MRKTPLIALIGLFSLMLFLSPAQKAHSQSAASPSGKTPLVDFTSGQKYLNTFKGFLYTDPTTGTDSNTVPSQHDKDGQAIAATIQPLDANGKPSATGKIGVMSIGMSNWTDEFCTERPEDEGGVCPSYSFMGTAAANPSVDHTTLVLADCAKGGQDAHTWLDDSFGNYSFCLNTRLPLWHITAKQVQVVMWKEADGDPKVSMTSKSVCTFQPLPIRTPPNPDVCSYEEYLGIVARFLKTMFPNVKQMFVHSRIYAGYASPNDHLNPEPYAYEYGFANKWFVNAQVVQIAKGIIDPVAGDLNYNKGTAPWINWGPYWWANGTVPCKNCEIPNQTWLKTDYQVDFIHPNPSGDQKVANNLVNYYLASPYSPWFR